MSLAQEIMVAALAELGYTAEPIPGQEIGVGARGVPCEIKWKAAMIARLSTGKDAATFERWHSSNVRRYGDKFDCRCGLADQS